MYGISAKTLERVLGVLTDPRRREKILEGLSSISLVDPTSASIDAFFGATLVDNYRRHCFEPDNLLVLGGVGTGKTHLFRLMSHNAQATLGLGGRTDLVLHTIGLSFPYPFVPNGCVPSLESIRRFFARHKSPGELENFWLGTLVGGILNSKIEQVDRLFPESVVNALRVRDSIDNWYYAVAQSVNEIRQALLRLDGYLRKQDLYLLVLYDGIEDIFEDLQLRNTARSSLSRFYWYVWRQTPEIRPKLFFLNDEWTENAILQGGEGREVGWLSGHMFRTAWPRWEVFRLAFKLWANQNEESREFLEAVGIDFKYTPLLGYVYSEVPTEDVLRHVVYITFGKYMAVGTHTGDVYNQIVHYLSDCKGELTPAALVALLSGAAQEALRTGVSDGIPLVPSHLLVDKWTEIRKRRLTEISSAFPWAKEVFEILSGVNFPIRYIELVLLLDKKLPSDFPYTAEKLVGILEREGLVHVLDKEVVYTVFWGQRERGRVKRPRTPEGLETKNSNV